MKESQYNIIATLFATIVSLSAFSQQSSKEKFFPEENAPVMVKSMPSHYKNVPETAIEVYNPFQFDILAIANGESMLDTVKLKRKSKTRLSKENCALVIYVKGKPCESKLLSGLSYRLYFSKKDTCYIATSLLGRNLNSND